MQYTEYHFFALGAVEWYCFLRRKVARTSHGKRIVCVYFRVCMCVLTYSVRSQINFLFKMWKLYRTSKGTPSHNQFQYTS